MLGRLLLASDLRTCPVCGSCAVSGMDGRELDGSHTRWMLRCGECQTWRAFVVGLRRGRGLERRFARLLERDRRRIAGAVRRVEHTDDDGTRPARSCR